MGPDPMNMDVSFERSELLSDMADNIIIPALENYQGALEGLQTSKDAFVSDPSVGSLTALRSAWLEAYLSWQSVSIFDIGQAEAIGLRNFTNIYPTDVAAIESNISSGDYNLQLPSNFDTQGFPALDYLLFGIADNEEGIVALLSNDSYMQYLSDVVDRLDALTTEVVDDWNNGFRVAFIANNGSSATASTDKIVNDFIFYYERFLRAGKIGIPAGVFSNSAISANVEAPFSRIYSKQLFLAGFQATRDFFMGRSSEGFDMGFGLDDYLDAVATANGTGSVATAIIDQWTVAQSEIDGLMDDFVLQIEQDNVRMLQAYDELQRAVILLKVDMLQALNIQVDFVDADGD
jgi:predicted lipoprotein